MLGHLQIHLSLSLPTALDSIINIFYGVPVFFIMSGYLIFISLSKTYDWKLYFNKRILRLYPELWICVTLSLLSIILLYDAYVPIIDYLKFGFTQSTVFQFWTPDSLRGFGNGTPNGSLWTISVIVQFYILIFIFYKFLKKSEIGVWLTVITLCVLWPAIVYPYISKFLPLVISKLIKYSILNHMWLFLIGALMAKFLDELLPVLKKYWFVFLAMCIIFQFTDYDVWASYPLFRTVFLGLFFIGAAYSLPMLNVKKDISYGIYIYHMVFANIAIELGYTQNWPVFILCIVVSIVAAYISYETIGVFSKNKRQRIISTANN